MSINRIKGESPTDMATELEIPESFHPAYVEELANQQMRFNEIFDLDWFTKFARTFELSDGETQKLVEALHLFSSQYLADRQADTIARRVGPRIRQRFCKIEKTAAALHTQLQQLNEAERQVFWSPQGELNCIAMQAEGRPVSSVTGHSHIAHSIDDDTIQFDYLSNEKIEEAVRILKAYAHHAAIAIAPDKGGQFADRPLLKITRSLRSFWIRQLGRKFTFDSHKGEGTTAAFDFCKRIIQTLDPEIELTKITNTVSSVRRTLRS
jgi:hypothetical protein